MFDLVIKNALIYDGTGKPPFHGCIAVQDGKIAKAMAPYEGIYTTHSRSESAGLFGSVAERIHIAREAKVGVNISTSSA